MPSPVPSPSDASKNPYVSTIGGNSVTTSVPLVDDGGEDANVTVFYGTVRFGLSSAPWVEYGVQQHWLDISCSLVWTLGI